MPHTPGPWHIDSEKDDFASHGRTWIILGPNDEVVAQNIAWEDAPDARLMAAAPQLLSMLTEAADWLGHFSNCKASDDCLKASRDLIDHLKGDK